MTVTDEQFPGESAKIMGYFPQRIFVRKDRKKRKKAQSQTEPQPTWAEWQSSDFDQFVEDAASDLGENKKGVGRPTVPPNILQGRRDDIATMLESEWVHIGWKLHCLRNPAKESQSPDLVKIAFEPVRGKHGSERIPFLLRPTSLPAKSADVRAAKKASDAAHEKLQTVRSAHEAQITKFKDLWRAYYETSGRHREQLKKEITLHIGNRIRLEKGIVGKEKLARSLRHQEQFKSELLDLHKELENCRGWLLQENETVDGLAKRYALAITNRVFVRTKVKDCIANLRLAKNELQQQTEEAHRLEELYFDQAAGFARQDFLEFSLQQRGKHHPRHVANALAGLPEMASRQSYPKCRQIPFQRDPHPDFQTFSPTSTTLPGMMVWGYGTSGTQTCPTNDFCIFGFPAAPSTTYGWQPSSTPPTPALSTQFMQITAPSSGAVYPISYISTVPISEGGTNATTAAAGQIPNSSSGTTSTWTNTPTLGGSGTAGSLTIMGGSTTPGSLAIGNSTTGLITVQPVTGALGTQTISLPAATGTVAVSATPPITETTAGAVACPTCVTSTSSLTDTAIMTGDGGAQGSQTPSTGATLTSSGNMSLPGSLTIGGHLNQNAAKTFAGSCTMMTATSCTFTITASFSNTPLTFVSQDGSNASVSQIAAKCSLSGTTVTITAATGNGLTWDCLIVGNPN